MSKVSDEVLRDWAATPKLNYYCRDVQLMARELLDLRAKAAAGKWQPIETAPKDGSLVLLFCNGYEIQSEDAADIIQKPPFVALGKWDHEGTSWVDNNGTFDGPAYRLEVTGVWESGGGWFQPNEVSYWMPLPAAPEAEKPKP